jgi:adhesin/invasin
LDAGGAGIGVGTSVTALGTGFAPGEQVRAVMQSDPVDLGTQTAAADGSVSFTWKIPEGTTVGQHTVTLTGLTSGRFAMVAFTVLPDNLAATGADQSVVALLALATGCFLIAAGSVRLSARGARRR